MLLRLRSGHGIIYLSQNACSLLLIAMYHIATTKMKTCLKQLDNPYTCPIIACQYTHLTHNLRSISKDNVVEPLLNSSTMYISFYLSNLLKNKQVDKL